MPGMSIVAADLPVRRTRVRWAMVTMAFFATAIAYLHRASLGVAAPYIQKELGFSGATMGFLLGTFFWTYAGFMMPSGWFVDRAGPRLAYALAVTLSSVANAGCAVARGLAGLVGLRLLLGVGQAPTYPSNAKIVAEWFPRSERAFATSIFDSGSRVGNLLSLPIISGIIGVLGWRASFALTATLGVAWTAIWLRAYRSPRQHRSVSAAELAYIEAGRAIPVAETPTRPVLWRHLFRYRTVWGMMLGVFCFNFVIYFFITWFPTYLVRERGFTVLKLGVQGMIPPACAVLAGYAGGLVSDRLGGSRMRPNWARKLPIAGGMILSSSIGLAVIAPTATWALVLLAVSYSGLAFAAAGIWSLPADISPSRNHVASLSGIQNCASNLAGITSPLFVGKMVDVTGGFVAPLMIAGGVALLGAFSYLVIVPAIAPLSGADR